MSSVFWNIISDKYMQLDRSTNHQNFHSTSIPSNYKFITNARLRWCAHKLLMSTSNSLDFPEQIFIWQMNISSSTMAKKQVQILI